MENRDNFKKLAAPCVKVDDLLLEKKEEKRNKLYVVLTFFIGVILSTFFGSLLYSSFNRDFIRANEGQVRGEKVSSSEQEYIQDDPIDKLAYITKNGVYVYVPNSEKVISVSDNYNSTYTSIAWRNKEELSYSECDGKSCQIKTYNLKKRAIVDDFSVKGEEIFSIRWSHKGNSLAYLFKEGESLFLTLKSEKVLKSLGRFSFDAYKAEDIGDNIYLRFSPNDENILFVNTFCFVEDPSVVVVNVYGKKLIALEKTYLDTPSSAFFMSNELIYYKSNGLLYLKTIGDKEKKVVLDRVYGAYDYYPSPDRSSVTFWTYDWLTGISTIWVYTIGTDDLQRLRDQESMPAWIGNRNLISIHTKDCKQCFVNDFEVKQFDGMNLKTSVVSKLLNTEGIITFTSDNI